MLTIRQRLGSCQDLGVAEGLDKTLRPHAGPHFEVQHRSELFKDLGCPADMHVSPLMPVSCQGSLAKYFAPSLDVASVVFGRVGSMLRWSSGLPTFTSRQCSWISPHELCFRTILTGPPTMLIVSIGVW